MHRQNEDPLDETWIDYFGDVSLFIRNLQLACNEGDRKKLDLSA
jgi:hypothetical protein